MDKQGNCWRVVLGVLFGISFGMGALAATCPANLQQDSKGYWTSNDPPGWKSYRPTGSNVAVDAKHFGGAVYSPTKKRIACVYKGSDGKWVVLLSSVYYPFSKDDLSSAWEYNPKHKDHICGEPKQTLKDCKFDVKNNETRRQETHFPRITFSPRA